MNRISQIGQIFGAGAGEDDYQAYIQKALDEYAKLKQPTVDQLSGGNVTSSYSSEDPRTRDVQMSAIDELRNLYANHGVDARSKANLDEIRRSEDLRARGAREAINQNQASRGFSGGSAANQMLNAVGSADRRSARDTQVYGQNEGRAMDALLNSTRFAGDVRGQDFNKMSALDRIKEFNNNNKSNAYQQNFNNAYGITGKRADLYGNRGKSMADQYNQRFGFGSEIIGTAAKMGAGA